MKRKHTWMIATAAALVTTLTLTAQAQQTSPDQDSKNARLLAAAEPFEGLTEQSFSAKPQDLDRMIRNVRKATDRVTSILPAQDQSALTQELQKIGDAKAKNDRSGLALSAVEGYRILVSATHGTKVPAEVSLLDYSGFRYDADLKANPVRWTDMQDAAGFAAKQWQSISERVTDAGLKQRVSDALHEMETAASDKSAVNAHAAANAELDLVDTLEVWFNRGKA